MKKPRAATEPALNGDKPQKGPATQDWDGWVAQHPTGELLQLEAWRKLKCRFGWNAGAVQIKAGESLQAGAQILYRRAFGLTLAYVPRGPVVDWADDAQVQVVLNAIEEDARRQGAAVIKLEPPLHDSLAVRSQLSRLGYALSRQTVQPPSTIRIDLRGSEDAILQRMKSKWRYNIRLAQRKEVTVREMDAADLPLMDELMAVTATRDGFAVHSPDYYRTAYELLVPRHAVFLLAEYAGKPLAAIVVAHCGETASYLWGASNNEERNRMPNHALQWAGMKWAKARGAAWYDLWGVPDAIGMLAMGMNQGTAATWPADALPVDMEQLPTHDLWGVYRFKQGFGGEAVRYVGAWDKLLEPIGGRVYQLGLWARDAVQAVRAADDPVAMVVEKARQTLTADVPAATRPAQRTAGADAAVSLPVPDAVSWRKALATFAAPHLLQSWEWGEVKAQTGWTAHRFLLKTTADASTPIAAFQLLQRRFLPGLPLGIGYITKGPVADWATVENPDAILAQIETTARKLGCIFVKIDPDVRRDLPAGHTLEALLVRRGWQVSPNQIQFQNTAYSYLNAAAGDKSADDDVSVGDATGAEEALLAGMKSKWRYNIRLAARRGIRVRQGSVADLPLFYALYAETGRRDGFLVRPYGYYLETWRTFLEAEPDNPAGGALLLAEHPDELEPPAGLFLMRYGKRAWYFYGASSERRRRDMPNYLLQWEALRWSMANGCTIYDWWGAPTDPDNPDDPMQGVWQFKQGFGADLQMHVGAWDYPVWPAAYRLFTQALPRGLALLRQLRTR